MRTLIFPRVNVKTTARVGCGETGCACHMVTIHAEGMDHKALNDAIRGISELCTIDGCCGQRFIAAGMADKTLDVYGVPGNALGAYLNGGTITVRGGAQDAVGDTMNEGKIVIHGNIGDAAGYAMRGGKIFVKGNAGYCAGIHIIINSPLPDDTGVRFAIDTASSKGAAVLLLVRGEVYEGIFDKVVEHGVFTLQKPVSPPLLSTALEWMESAKERLRKLEQKTLTVEEKMEEIRIVNRAKWLLISELKMDEPQAHHYIEKQAMDRCTPKRVVAEEIIKTYT